MSRSKDKGTWWETAVVRWLRDYGFEVDRMPVKGSRDEGDIQTGVVGWTLECKNERAYKLAEWIGELEREMDNAGTAHGAVIAHRRGKASPDDAYIIMPGWAFARLLKGKFQN